MEGIHSDPSNILREKIAMGRGLDEAKPGREAVETRGGTDRPEKARKVSDRLTPRLSTAVERLASKVIGRVLSARNRATIP